MHPVAVVVVKTLCGGLLVVVFAVLSEMITPKRFAGILSAAPSVALAGLTVGVIADGAHHETPAARTMMAGAVAMIAFAVAAVVGLRRLGLLATTVLGSVVWALVALGLYGASA